MCERCREVENEAEAFLMCSVGLTPPKSELYLSAERVIAPIVEILHSIPNPCTEDAWQRAAAEEATEKLLGAANGHDLCNAVDVLLGVASMAKKLARVVGVDVKKRYVTRPDELTESTLKMLNELHDEEAKRALLAESGVPAPLADMLIAMGLDVERVEHEEHEG